MKKSIFIIILIFILFGACKNPFAPTLIIDDNSASLLGDQKTIEGFFQNFQYAYNFKDTITYSNLLDKNFIFSYRNYDIGADASLTRNEDLFTTYRLFLAAQSLDLVWNNILLKTGDSVQLNITRSFNLSITFSSTDIVRLYGKANLKLVRPDTSSVWKLIRWEDESVY